MPELSYDELEASVCGLYSYEPRPDEKPILEKISDAEDMESRKTSVPKLWLTPYKSRFREQFTPSHSSDEGAEYETPPEDAGSEYEECLPIPPKSELRKSGLGLPHNKNREVQIVDNVFRGDEEVDGVDANIDLSLIDGSCPAFERRRNVGLPPVPAKHPQRQKSVAKDTRMRQDSTFAIPPLDFKRRQSRNESSNETLVASSGASAARSSPKSASPAENSEFDPGHPDHPLTERTDFTKRFSLASIRDELRAVSSDEEDADDEADQDSRRRQLARGWYVDELRRRNSVQQKDAASSQTISNGQDPDTQTTEPAFKTARALQQGKQSLDDAYLMDLMHVHPAVRMEAFKRNLHVPKEGPFSPGASKNKRTEDSGKKSGYRFNSLEGLVPKEDERS